MARSGGEVRIDEESGPMARHGAGSANNDVAPRTLVALYRLVEL
jgi:hypothetical protein